MTKVDCVRYFLPIFISIITFIYTVWKNRETQKLQNTVKKVQLDVLKASEIYGQVKLAKRLYEDALTNLIVMCSDTSIASVELQKYFLTAYNRYTDFFNEINDYCIMVNSGAIKAEDYIKNTISVNLSKFATIQYTTFFTLQNIAIQHGFAKLSCPDYKSFKEYDEFLIKYNGENSAFWSEIKTKRKEVGFE